MRRTSGGEQRIGLSILLPAAMLAASAAASPPAIAQRIEATVRLNIPAQPLRTALLALSRQTGIEILVAPSVIGDLRAPAIKGVMPTQTALARLISGSGLEARHDGNSYVLVRAAVDKAPIPSEAETDTVTVVGYSVSLLESLKTKREADQVIDAVTAEEFGQFPDQNIAESMQRITGISMTRDNGEGDSISIRGLEPDLTRIQLNGRGVYLTLDDDQPALATSLAIFASDQFAAIEVAKSPTARDDEGGVGGVVRLSTPKPFDLGESVLRASVQWRDSSITGGLDPRYTGMASAVSEDGRIGALIALSFDERTRRVDQMRSLEGWTTAKPAQTQSPEVQPLTDKAYPVSLDQQLRIGEQPRANLDFTVQYRSDDAFQLLLNADYASEDRRESISRAALNIGRAKPFLSGEVDPQTGTIESLLVDGAQLTLNNRGLNRDIMSWGVTINPQWNWNDWHVSTRADYSVGEEVAHDRRVRHRSNRVLGYSIKDDDRAPSFDLSRVDLSDLSVLALDQNMLEYRLIRTDESAGQVDVRHALRGAWTELAAGLKIRQIGVDRREGIANGSVDYSVADAVSPFPLNDFFDGAGGPDFLRAWPYIDANTFVDRYGPSEQEAEDAVDPMLGYSLKQRTFAGYAMASFDAGYGDFSWRGNAGLRGVHARFEGEGVRQTSGPGGRMDLVPRSTASSDTEWLPSVNLAITSNHVPDLVLRLAAARVMTRPRPAQLNPTVTLSTNDMSLTRGNPDLKPFVANQIDAGAEYYFGDRKDGLVALALFHKDIQNFVEPVVLTEPAAASPGQPAEETQVSTYVNGGRGRVSGVEFNLQAPLSLIAAPLEGFGGAFNYTWLDSSRELADGRRVAIPGNSRKTINATLYYDNGPFSARASYNFRDSYLEEEFGPSDNRIIVDDDGRLDLSFRYRLENGLRLSFDVANLTGEGRFSYADVPDRLISNQLEGRAVLVSVGYVFQ